MTTTETTAATPTTTETARTGFTEAAAYLLRSAERAVERNQPHPTANAAYTGTWTMRDLVLAETERDLYRAALSPRGEARFVHDAALLLTESARTTDAFARAVTEAQREVALRALRNLRGELSVEARLALVDQL